MFGIARVSLAVSALALLAFSQQNAANAADEVTVKAKIVPSCVVAAATLDFDALSATVNNNASTSIGLTACGSLTSVKVSLGTGDHATQNGTRQLNNGTDDIVYTLSTGGAAITDTSEHTVGLTSGAGALAVSGLIDPLEVGSKSGGNYLDALDVTVDFAS